MDILIALAVIAAFIAFGIFVLKRGKSKPFGSGGGSSNPNVKKK